MDKAEQVLVTGGSGFIASNCIAGLLKKGYHVKATLRSLKRISEVKEMLSVAGITDFKKLSFVEADLSNESSWMKAAVGCQYIIHPDFSPYRSHSLRHEGQVIWLSVLGRYP